MNHIQQNLSNCRITNQIQTNFYINSITHLLYMGNLANICGGDPFDKLMKQYGDQMVKFIVAEKSKQIINQKCDEFKKQSNLIFTNYENQTKGQIEFRVNQLHQLFESAKNQINNVIPGGIATVQKIKGQNIGDIIGFNGLISKIETIKNQCWSRFGDIRQKFQGQFQQKKKLMIDQINKKKPYISFYDDLPESMQKQVFKKAEQTFKNEIQENKAMVLKQIAQSFKLQTINSSLSEINSLRQIDSIINTSNDLFNGNINALKNAGTNLINKGIQGLGNIAKFF